MKRTEKLSAEEQLVDSMERTKAILNMLNQIRDVDEKKRILNLKNILIRIKGLKEPELSDQLDILKATVKRGYLLREFEEAIRQLRPY